MFEAALEGLAGVLQPEAFMFMCLGVGIGSLVGFLPGIGGPSTLALMLPFVAKNAFRKKPRRKKARATSTGNR